MLNRFKHIVEEMKGLVEGSALLSSSPTRSGILLAVSGGIDSMCLADLWLKAFGSDTFAIAHCNFNLRGEDSDADEALVTGWAEAVGVRLHKVSFDTVQYASENGLSIEMAARELRYMWFAELCREHGNGAVVTAHHADDNAETMVLNMVRGTGLKGLSGMKPVSALPYSSCVRQSEVIARSEPPYVIARSEATWQSLLLRPLLTFTRKQIEGYAFANKVPYREDKTNASVEYRRNSIRHEVFPLFERMNPSYVRTLNREMTCFKDAADIVDQWCRDRLPKVVTQIATSHPLLAIHVQELLAVPQWRYLLYYILDPYGFNSSVLESLEALLTSDRTLSGKRFEADEYLLLTERDRLVVVKKTGHDESAAPDRGSVIPGLTRNLFMPVRGAGTYNVGKHRFVVETLSWTSDMPLKQPAGTLVFDASKLKFPFVCRSWRKGDWFKPLGMRGKKKVSDFFADLKYGQIEKLNALMIVDCTGDKAENQHIAGILGNRMDDHYKVTEDTVSVIRISVADPI